MERGEMEGTRRHIYIHPLSFFIHSYIHTEASVAYACISGLHQRQFPIYTANVQTLVRTCPSLPPSFPSSLPPSLPPSLPLLSLFLVD